MRSLLLVVLVGCSVDAVIDDPIENAIDGFRAGKDPCADTDARKAAIDHAPGDPHRFVGTEKRDVIFGTNAADVIFGNGGDDLICAFGGADYIDGGDGRDHIFAGNDDDIVHGRGGSDYIYGGRGDDTIFGDILDDHLYGEEGNDVLIGGHGTDEFFGGPGNDFMRGDTGNDSFDGGPDYDIVSFATATPPGQPEIKNDGTPNTIDGVAINDGKANGDGGQEPLAQIEEIVGSEFSDRLNGRTEQPTFGEATPTPTSTAFIRGAVDHQGKLVDVGVVVLGSTGANGYQLVGKSGSLVDIVGANPPAAGDGCVQLADRTRCDVGAFIGARAHRESPFHYVVVWGDAGADKIDIRGDYPREFEATADGGEGTDHLTGGDEQDIFFTGVSGEDVLEGNGGDDALISLSHHTAAWEGGGRPEASRYTDGADTLDGGAGNDQLVSDYVCGGHRYIGGPGHDIAGFARSGTPAINAQLGGPSRTKTRWWGKAANMALCGNLEGRWTTFKTGQDADLEVLEASDGPDNLWGDDRPNVIWGRDGADKIDPLGGYDEVLGADGNDDIVQKPGDFISFGNDH